MTEESGVLNSKVRRINLKVILLNQLKWILDKLFRILLRQYQSTQLHFRPSFSSPTQAFFFLTCSGNSMGAGYHPHIKLKTDKALFIICDICM